MPVKERRKNELVVPTRGREEEAAPQSVAVAFGELRWINRVIDGAGRLVIV